MKNSSNTPLRVTGLCIALLSLFVLFIRLNLKFGWVEKSYLEQFVPPLYILFSAISAAAFVVTFLHKCYSPRTFNLKIKSQIVNTIAMLSTGFLLLWTVRGNSMDLLVLFAVNFIYGLTLFLMFLKRAEAYNAINHEILCIRLGKPWAPNGEDISWG